MNPYMPGPVQAPVVWLVLPDRTWVWKNADISAAFDIETSPTLPMIPGVPVESASMKEADRLIGVTFTAKVERFGWLDEGGDLVAQATQHLRDGHPGAALALLNAHESNKARMMAVWDE